MHELGIVFHIIKEVEEVAKSNNVERVTSVTLEVGEVSMVVSSYLEDCWKWAVDNRSTYMKGCNLRTVVLPAITYCESCSKTYETVKYAKVCPYCGSHDTYLKTGDEVMIKDIEVI